MRIGLILVAAGYGWLREDSSGKRISKLLEPVSGEPLFLHPLMRALRAGIEQAVIVVNPLYGPEMLDAIEAAVRKNMLPVRPMVVVQQDRYGSGDAVMCAIPAARDLGMTHALIVYADMPRWSIETMRTLLEESRSDACVTMLTAERHDSFPALERYGRVVRDQSGGISGIVEVEDPAATSDILAERRVNPSLWVWNLSWLATHIPLVPPVKRPDGRCSEIYLPPLVRMAREEGVCVHEVCLAIERGGEALGVNTPEELAFIQ
ncbi:MAG: NTP transferase domain-containing protein [Candidatus Kaiserbacteria bacterium]|nr:NTP transferase domain-containing protein [Candidatus Kaiserbacteria bacterium]